MNSSPRASTLTAKLPLLLFFASLCSIYLLSGTLTPVIAQSTERELIDQIPKHLPIKVKIKKEKEKAFKDLNNEKWVRDFELEITNTGNKPIYFLSLSVTLPGITSPDGHTIGFVIHYGRNQLANVETPATADDMPIKPGEAYVFSFAASVVDGWERFKQRENKPDPKKVILLFQILSFGDRTGFMRSDGIAVPHAPDAKASTGGCELGPKLSDSRGLQGTQAS